MDTSKHPGGSGEYAVRGDYHRVLDPAWPFYPTYLAKMAAVRVYLDGLPPGAAVLDAGCGEGVLVEEYAGRLHIEGVDEHYASAHVRKGSLLALPSADETFDVVLCLDVLEHLAFPDQPRALEELRRVLRPSGESAHLDPEPRAPAVSRAFPPARLAHPDCERTEAPG